MHKYMTYLLSLQKEFVVLIIDDLYPNDIKSLILFTVILLIRRLAKFSQSQVLTV
jgi:hypothetical protein